jgi:uncharacterized damage-inducible protein DinB
MKQEIKSFFKELFEYNHAMNQKLISSFAANQSMTSEKSVKLIGHILNAHHIWNSRIDRKPSLYGVWESHSLTNFKEVDELNYKASSDILDKYDLTTEVDYTNTKNQAFKNTVKDILFHIINHSTYHRAQIASDFKQNELEPLISDYIFYKR